MPKTETNWVYLKHTNRFVCSVCVCVRVCRHTDEVLLLAYIIEENVYILAGYNTARQVCHQQQDNQVPSCLV